MKQTDHCHVAAEANTAGARPCGRVRVTAAAYRGHTPIPSFARSSVVPAPTFAWTMNGLEVTKVDFHDRWPLHSTS